MYTNLQIVSGHGIVDADNITPSSKILAFSTDDVVMVSPFENKISTNMQSIRVSTNSNREIDCSEDGTVVTLDSNLNFIRTTPRKGLCVPCIKDPLGCASPRYNENYTLDVQYEQRYRWNSTISLNHDFGYINGVYIGDGWSDFAGKSTKNGVHYAKRSPELKENIERIWNSYLLNGYVSLTMTPSVHYFEGHKSYSEKFSFRSKTISKYIHQNLGSGALNKHLPPYWYQTNTDYRWGLLAGLIDTDGTVFESKAKSKPNSQFSVRYCTSSPKLKNQVKNLGHSLGLSSGINISIPKSGNPSYNVIFHKESLRVMQKKLKLTVKKKADTLERFTFGEAKNVHKYAPMLTDKRMKELRKEISGTRILKNNNNDVDLAKEKRLYGAVSDALRRERKVLIYDTAMEIISLDLDIFSKNPFWKKWKDLLMDKRFDWDVITQVENNPGKSNMVLPKTDSDVFIVALNGILL